MTSNNRPRLAPTQLTVELAVRLRVLKAEMMRTDEQMAALLNVGRTTWTNWLNLEGSPDPEAMVRLCKIGHVTMNWLYTGDVTGLPLGHAIRLTARLHGLDPDAASVDVLHRAAPAPDRLAQILGKAARHIPR